MSEAPLVQTGALFTPHDVSRTSQLPYEVTVLENGNIVYCWAELVFPEDGSLALPESTIRYRVFSPALEPITPELQANSFPNKNQDHPTIASLEDGGFVIVWMSYGQHQEFGHALYGQRFDAAGIPVGDEFRVTDDVMMNEYYPCVDALPDGGWIVTWRKYYSVDENGAAAARPAIYQIKYDASGQPITDSEPVATSIKGVSQGDPQATVLPDGGWVSVWAESDMQGSSVGGIYQVRYGADGEPVGDVELVSVLPASIEPDYLYGKRSNPSVTVLADGGWIVGWEGTYQDGPNPRYDYDADIYFQRYDVDGNRIGEETHANPYEPGNQQDPEIIALEDGGWIVLWTEEVVPIEGGYLFVDRYIFGQRYSSDGLPIGKPFEIEDPVSEFQQIPDVVALSDGTLLVSWYGYNFQSDLSRPDIVAATYSVPVYFSVGEDGPAVDLELDAAPGAVDGEVPRVVSIDTTGSLGVVTLNPDRVSFSYDPDGAFEDLKAGEIATTSFAYTISNGETGIETVTINISVMGANEAPEVLEINLGDVSEDGSLITVDVLALAVDVDSDLSQLSAHSVQATWNGGQPLIADLTDGVISFDPTQLSDFLDEGDLAEVLVTFDLSDGEVATPSTISLTVLGADEAPVLNHVSGTAANDSLIGTDADDSISTLGGQLDWTVGLSGNDTFIFGDETRNGVREVDIVLDFEVGKDSIALEGEASMTRTIEFMGGVWIKFDGDLDLVWVRGSNITSEDILII